MKLLKSFTNKWKEFFSADIKSLSTDYSIIDEKIFSDKEYQIEIAAYAFAMYQTNNSDWNYAKDLLSQFGLNEKQKEIIIDIVKAFIKDENQQKILVPLKVRVESFFWENKIEDAYHLALSVFKENKDIFECLVILVQILLKQQKNQEAFDVAYSYYHEYKNIETVELLTQILDNYKSENDILDFYEKLKETSPNEKNSIEYKKGLYLKSKKRFEEAKQIFRQLNSEKEFGWNYYQIGIIENLQGNVETCLSILEKAFNLDSNLKIDAKKFQELSNLWNNKTFISLTN